jgi:hypothetical protein
MKPTDFSIHVTSFLTHYLAAQRNLSPNTIKAYRDVFTLLLRFCRDVRGISPEKLRLEQIDVSLVGSIPGSLGDGKKIFAAYAKSSACHFARILPIRSGRRAGPHGSMPENPRDSPTAARSLNGRIPFQRRTG